MRDLDYGELTGGMWIYDELATELEEADIVKCFTEDFLRMFPSFNRICPEPVSYTHLILTGYSNPTFHAFCPSSLDAGCSAVVSV